MFQTSLVVHIYDFKRDISVNIVEHVPWGFLITINLGKVNFSLCPQVSESTKTRLISGEYLRRNVLFFIILTGFVFKATEEN